MAMKIWPTLKRLLFLERERMAYKSEIASLVDLVDCLERALGHSRDGEARALRRVAELEAELEIDRMLRAVEG